MIIKDKKMESDLFKYYHNYTNIKNIKKHF